MASLAENFKELVERVRQGRELGHASFEPIYYLIFPPSQILEVKRTLPAWVHKLTNDGWQVHQFSMAQAIQDILDHAPLMKIWQVADSKAPLAWDKTNQSLANALTGGSFAGAGNGSTPGALQTRFAAQLDELAGRKNTILFVTDLEALHPYIRIGAIESQLYGKFTIPTVFLYPGKRTGKTRLQFLNFYPEDGNYRSVHIGG